MSSKTTTSKSKPKSKSNNTTKIDLVLAARKISVAKEKKSLVKSFKKILGLKGGKNKTRQRRSRRRV